MNRKSQLYIIAGVVAAIAVIFASTSIIIAPKVPSVKFVAFTPDSKQTIKEDQIIPVSFRVHNSEQRDIDNARVTTTQKGDSRFFAIDKPDFTITPTIGAKEGESGTQTIMIKGINLGTQPAIEDTFTINLYVGIELADSREIAVRLEPNM